MNQKAFAIFVGAIMVLSAFAGFVLRGDDNSDYQGAATSADATPTSAFGIGGYMVDSSFTGLSDMLSMMPESTALAYWIDMDGSENLTGAARAAIPQQFQSYGLYSSSMYSTEIERLGAVFMNDSSFVEFHYITPYRIAYNGFTVPYQNYQLLPLTTDVYAVLGKPVVFGAQRPVESVIDVLSGGFSTDRITLPMGEYDGFQIAGLGKGSGMDLGTAGGVLPLGGGYDEFYLGVSQMNSTYSLNAIYLDPDGATDKKVAEIAGRYGLSVSSRPGEVKASGEVTEADMRDALKAFLAP